MKLSKYLGNYLKEQGVNNFDFDLKQFLSVCKNFSVDMFSKEELEHLKHVIEKGANRNFQEAVNNYFETKYENTDVWNTVIQITEEDDYEYADNFRISDGSSIDTIIYKTAKIYGCCGFYDKHLSINNKDYKIGFNYGH